MTTTSSSPVWGILLSVLGGCMNGSFGVPLRFVEQRRLAPHEYIWLVYTLFGLISLPAVCAWCALGSEIIAHAWNEDDALRSGLESSPGSFSVELVILCGVAWGIGSLVFGWSIRRVGLGVAFPVVLALMAAVGSVGVLIWKNSPSSSSPSSTPSLFGEGREWFWSGICMLLFAVVLCVIAARMRKQSLRVAYFVDLELSNESEDVLTIHTETDISASLSSHRGGDDNEGDDAEEEELEEHCNQEVFRQSDILSAPFPFIDPELQPRHSVESASVDKGVLAGTMYSGNFWLTTIVCICAGVFSAGIDFALEFCSPALDNIESEGVPREISPLFAWLLAISIGGGFINLVWTVAVIIYRTHFSSLQDKQFQQPICCFTCFCGCSDAMSEEDVNFSESSCCHCPFQPSARSHEVLKSINTGDTYPSPLRRRSVSVIYTSAGSRSPLLSSREKFLSAHSLYSRIDHLHTSPNSPAAHHDFLASIPNVSDGVNTNFGVHDSRSRVQLVLPRNLDYANSNSDTERTFSWSSRIIPPPPSEASLEEVTNRLIEYENENESHSIRDSDLLLSVPYPYHDHLSANVTAHDHILCKSIRTSDPSYNTFSSPQNSRLLGLSVDEENHLDHSTAQHGSVLCSCGRWMCIQVSNSSRKQLVVWLSGLVMGILWFGGMWLYAAGSRLESSSTVVCWSVYLCSVIMTANVWGFFLGEWKETARRDKMVMICGLLSLVLAIVFLTIVP